MSSFIAAVLKATVGLLVNKGRNVAAEKLKEGDVTDEQLRSLIVRELDDIKSKLDGLARKDLLASISFFKEGLVFLYKVKPYEEDGKNTQQGAERPAWPSKQDGRASEASVKTVSLAEEMRSLRLTDRDDSSARALNGAKDRFKQAREKATEAFCNEALSISDRILAMQYRIMATILENVDCLTDALAVCRLCLEELHSMQAVKKSFDVHLQQGFKSRFNKAEREDTIRSVCRMNRVIFYVTEIVEEDADFSLWPCVDSGEEKVDPLRDHRITKSLEKEDPEYFLLKAWPFFQEGEETMVFKNWFITTNTKGQLIIVATDHQCTLLKAFDRIGNLLQSVPLKLPVTESACPSSLAITDIASDRDSNVLLLVDRTQLNGDYKCMVTVFDQHANFQHEFDLNEGSHGTCITVSDDNKVFVAVEVGRKPEVQVYNFNGLFLNSIGNGILRTVVDLTATYSEGGKTMVLGSDPDLFFVRFVYEFSELGQLLPKLHTSMHSRGIYFLHKTEHTALLECIGLHKTFPVSLKYHKNNGDLVRRIKLHTPSRLRDSYANAEAVNVTTEGLVAMLATDERTGKKMIVIL